MAEPFVPNRADRAASDPVLRKVSVKHWTQDIPGGAWRALWLAGLGWLFEVYEIFILALTIPALARYFSLSSAQTGMIGAAAVFGLITGGIALGYVADRIGRVRTLSLAILIYSLFTCATAFASTAFQVGALRLLAGFGMGGAWSAGATLVAETWGPAHRGKGSALMQMGLPLGSLLAIGIAALATVLAGDLASGAWRWVYAVGLLPAVLLCPLARRTPDSEIWARRPRTTRGDIRDLLRGRNARGLTTAFSFIFFVQYTYWAVFTWTPDFLVSVKHLRFMHSLAFTLLQQAGALCGFLGFAFLVDRAGRRPTLSLYLLISAAAVAVFVIGERPIPLGIASLLTGFGVTGLFAGMGSFTAELVPDTTARGFAMGLAYNGGRTGGLLATCLVGALAATTAGFKLGLLTTLAALALALAVVAVAPETKGEALK